MMLILIILYLVYLSSGVPSPIIGAAWPLMYTELGVSVSLIGVITVIIAVFTIVACSMSSGIVAKIGTFKTLSYSLLTLALSVLGFGFSRNSWVLYLLSIPFGFSIGILDSTINSYIAVRYKKAFVNLLHGIGGLGTILSPMLVSFAISYQNNWRGGFYLAFYVVAIIWAILMLSIPAWKKASHIGTKTEEGIMIPMKEQIKDKSVIFICMIFIGTSILEYSIGVWGSTFFTDNYMILPEVAASLMTAFYAGMTIGRLLISAFIAKINYKKILMGTISCLAIPCVLLFFNLNVILFYILMFVFGMTNGSVFTLIVSSTPEIVGEEKAQSVIGTEISFAHLGCLFTHICLGILVKYFSISILPTFVMGGYVLLITSFLLFVMRKK